jgi:hypothetical protein
MKRFKDLSNANSNQNLIDEKSKKRVEMVKIMIDYTAVLSLSKLKTLFCHTNSSPFQMSLFNGVKENTLKSE